jgi:hypothetical protein
LDLQKNAVAMLEIAARFCESLAMTRSCTSCHCEERSDVAISRFSRPAESVLAVQRWTIYHLGLQGSIFEF